MASLQIRVADPPRGVPGISSDEVDRIGAKIKTQKASNELDLLRQITQKLLGKSFCFGYIFI